GLAVEAVPRTTEEAPILALTVPEQALPAGLVRGGPVVPVHAREQVGREPAEPVAVEELRGPQGAGKQPGGIDRAELIGAPGAARAGVEEMGHDAAVVRQTL